MFYEKDSPKIVTKLTKKSIRVQLRPATFPKEYSIKVVFQWVLQYFHDSLLKKFRTPNSVYSNYKKVLPDFAAN